MAEEESTTNNQDTKNQAANLPDNQEEFEFDSSEIKPKQIFVTDEMLKTLQKELSEYKDKYLRLLADSENTRKRMQKEKQEMTQYAIESFIIDFLRPLDNFENALRFAQEMSDEVKNWAFGFQMILTQFKDVLAQNGTIAFDSLGQEFNPHDHEAIEMVESSIERPGTITEEIVKGYRRGNRTIRAARVKVAKSGEKTTISQEKNSK